MMFLFAFHFDASFLWLTKFLSPNLNWTQSSWFWIIILSPFDSYRTKTSIKSFISEGLINGGYGCRRLNVLTTIFRCWWRFRPFRFDRYVTNSPLVTHILCSNRTETIAGNLTAELCYASLVEPFIHLKFQSYIS